MRFLGKNQTAVPAGGRFTFETAAMQGIGTRPRQEDAFALSGADDAERTRENALLAIMADGMGGLRYGKDASELCLSVMLAGYAARDPAEDGAEQLRRWAVAASDQIYARFGGDSGTTVVAGWIEHGAMHFLSVGDSFFYLRRGGELCRLNEEQNVRTRGYFACVRAGRLDPAEAEADPAAHKLTEYVGNRKLEMIDRSLRPLRLEKDDLLLLCSDGVGGVLPPAILNPLLDGTAEEICAKIEQAILAAGRTHQDNYTAVVIQCH